MLWIKSLHIIFVMSWFAGLFYLPRIFVNLAQETDQVAITRLLGMARRLLRFMTILAIPALIFGIWLVIEYGLGKSINGIKLAGWMHAKLGLVVLVLGYHHACGLLLKKFEKGINRHSERWYRWFNEVPVLLLLGIVICVVVKPF